MQSVHGALGSQRSLPRFFSNLFRGGAPTEDPLAQAQAADLVNLTNRMASLLLEVDMAAAEERGHTEVRLMEITGRLELLSLTKEVLMLQIDMLSDTATPRQERLAAYDRGIEEVKQSQLAGYADLLNQREAYFNESTQTFCELTKEVRQQRLKAQEDSLRQVLDGMRADAVRALGESNMAAVLDRLRTRVTEIDLEADVLFAEKSELGMDAEDRQRTEQSENRERIKRHFESMVRSNLRLMCDGAGYTTLDEEAILNDAVCLFARSSPAERQRQLSLTDQTWNNTPLLVACLSRSLELVRLLVSHGADVNARDHINKTVLHVAAMQGKTQLVRWLATTCPNRQFDVNSCDKMGRTPLHLAADKGHAETCSALLELGASANAVDENGFTPLMLAVSGKANPDVLRLLASRPDLDLSLRTTKRLSLLDMAASVGNVLPTLLDVIEPARISTDELSLLFERSYLTDASREAIAKILDGE